MHYTEQNGHHPNLLKGAVAGLIGGLIATAAKVAAEKVYPPHVHGEPEPPKELAKKIGGPLSLKKQTEAGEAIHWTFGALAGATYGAVAEYYPQATSRGGIGFGIALCSVTHEGILPVLKLAAPPAEQSSRAHNSEMATHIVYGIVAETVRHMVRKAID